MCQPLITKESCLIRFSAAYVDDCFRVNTQIKLLEVLVSIVQFVINVEMKFKIYFPGNFESHVWRQNST